MEIDYLSDLHTDFWAKHNSNEKKWKRQTNLFLNKLIPEQIGEVVVVAGDISHYNLQSFWVLEYLSQHYKQVFFVLGNHDYYLISEHQCKKYNHNSINRVNELIEMITDLSNVVLLQEYEPYDYNGTLFAGATNWYSLKEPGEQLFFNTVSNDSAAIIGLDIALEHEKEMAAYRNLKEVDVLVTHVPVIRLETHKKYNSTYCYLNELLPKAAHHIFGHCHEQDVKEKAGMHFYINALGYINEWTQHVPGDQISKAKRIPFYEQWVKIKSFQL